MRAFSLVELSIVLVILGLLTGGILAGQSLIRAAELRSISSDVQRFQAAIRSFQDKYMALPGDMLKATDFWGTASECPGSAAATDKATCNGNGSGVLQPLTTSGYGNEWFRFWQHLANAGLIEGSYSGTPGGGGTNPTLQPILGTNVPRSRIANSGFSVWETTAVTADGGQAFIGPAGNQLMFGSALGNSMSSDAIKPEEAWNIDTKMDDGRPSTGFIITPTSLNSNGGTDCASTAVAATAQYVLTESSNSCGLRFLIFGR